ncbi:c-type cytochrome [Pseudomonas soli]|uniref:c-type cytochrome n=1 Tax=Pseudomonas soli TaxID=1306993 RepID=UPI001E42F76B|nr:c-type cytochrome [Pseudomonas soli]WJO20317.1 c-type cytochrome [Pseudomonas soli]
MKRLTWIIFTILSTQAAASDPLPQGNIESGKRIFAIRCSQCHTTEKDGPNMEGPNLHGLFGSTTGFAKNYIYTDGNKYRGITWETATLFEYLLNPRHYIPGTKIAFAGLKKPQERADLIEYLRNVTQ